MTKLLLVEDDNNLREIYEARLQAEGYTIVSAHDGEEALVVAKAEKPDLIISDVMMPKISGFEMLDILRNTDGLRDVKVIMLTALGQSDDQQRADRLGADRYLVKSQVTLEDIVKVAHDLLNENGGDSAPVDPATEETTAPPELPAAPDLPSADPPAADPAPEPDATPTATPIPVADATTSATEEAAVEAQIEDFVAGASDSGPAPEAEPATAEAEPAMATPPEEKPAEPETPVETPDDSSVVDAVDEKLVSDAADALEASTKESEKPEEKESDLPQQKKVGGERVIEPIQSEPKKDIGDLLALEEAKEAGSTIPGAAANPVIVDDKEGPQTTATPPTTTSPAPGDKVDPNNIAL